MADLKVRHTSRGDVVVIGGPPGTHPAQFQVWWKDGRPYDFRVSIDDGMLTLDHLRAFIAWCDEQPTVKGKD